MPFESRLARRIVLAAIASASFSAVARTDDGRGHVATRVYDGADRCYAISLDAASEEIGIVVKDREGSCSTT